MELKPNPTYLFVLLPTDCFLDNSSAAWIGLQNIWPLFLTIFCFIAVSWVHSFTNLRIWRRTQLSAPGQTLHRANYSETVPWIRAFHTVWKQLLQSEMVPSGNSSNPHPSICGTYSVAAPHNSWLNQSGISPTNLSSSLAGEPTKRISFVPSWWFSVWKIRF